MTTDAAGKVTVVGLDKLLRKLDKSIPTHAKERLFKRGGEEGKANLAPRLPRRASHSQHSADKLSVKITSDKATLSVPSVPFRFLEGGTQAHSGEGARVHRKRTGAAWKSGSYRIKPRRFMANTLAWLKRQLPNWIADEEVAVKAEWDAS